MTNSKQKGKAGELEVAHILQDHGYQARRTNQYCGSTGDASDVVGMDGIHLEVKRAEKSMLYPWMAQAIRDASANPNKPKPVVVHRQSRQEWLAIMRFEDFIEMHQKLLAYEKALGIDSTTT